MWSNIATRYPLTHRSIRAPHRISISVRGCSRHKQLILRTMTATVRRLLMQAGLWTLFYFLPYLLSFEGQTNIYSLFERSGDVTHLISYLLLIAFSYFNYFWLIPGFYLRKKYLLYIFLLVAGFVGVIKVPQFFEPAQRQMSLSPAGPPPAGPSSGEPMPLPPPGPRNDRPPPRRSMPPPRSASPVVASPPHDEMPVLFGMNYNIILFLGSCFVALTLQYRAQLFRIEKEKLDAEVSFLKAQINPHFLFNTLNSIYSLAIEKSQDTPQAIVQLSELMRYILKDSGADRVELTKELQYIKNYVALQKRRLGDTVTIDFTVPETGGNGKIAPLLLMSFVENAFKYGVSPEEDAEIAIAIAIEHGKLKLAVSNKKVRSRQEIETTGIGIANTKGRLEHLYAGKYVLKIDDSENRFVVHLTIDIA